MPSKSAAEILEDAHVGSRPGYFSGRGVTLSDLDGRRLGRCHDEIRMHVGEEAAAAFVDMVAGMDRMTATGFINAVYRLEADGWTNVEGGHERHIDPDSEGSAFATVVDTLSRTRGGQARENQEMAADHQIRAGFLSSHGYRAMDGQGNEIWSSYGMFGGIGEKVTWARKEEPAAAPGMR